jgi:hypothetical protein
MPPFGYLAIHLAASPLAFADARLSCALNVLVALVWLVPDTRIARHLAAGRQDAPAGPGAEACGSGRRRPRRWCIIQPTTSGEV